MIGRQALKFGSGVSLFLAGAIAVPGCNQDAGQPARESISAPRNGGGVSKDVEGAKGKAPGTSKAGKALGGKGNL